MHLIRSSWTYFNVEVNSPKSSFAEFFLARPHSPGVLNKNQTIWLDAARPCSTHIPPLFPWNTPMQLHSIPTPRNTFASIEKLTKFVEITYLIKTSVRERVQQTHFRQQRVCWTWNLTFSLVLKTQYLQKKLTKSNWINLTPVKIQKRTIVERCFLV